MIRNKIKLFYLPKGKKKCSLQFNRNNLTKMKVNLANGKIKEASSWG